MAEHGRIQNDEIKKKKNEPAVFFGSQWVPTIRVLRLRKFKLLKCQTSDFSMSNLEYRKLAERDISYTQHQGCTQSCCTTNKSTSIRLKTVFTMHTVVLTTTVESLFALGAQRGVVVDAS